MAPSQRVITNPSVVHTPVGRYSHLAQVKASEMLFLAGQVGLDDDGKLVGEGDVGAQTRKAFQNIGKILDSAGASYSNIVQLTTYLVSQEYVQPYIDSRIKLFDEIFPGGDYPPNTLLIISGLLGDEMLIEVTAVAALP